MAGDAPAAGIRAHVATTWRRPQLRSLTAAVASALIAQNGFTIALAIYAHHRGGAGLVALAGVVQMAAAAASAPILGRLAAARTWRFVLTGTATVQAAAMVLCAVAVAAGASDLVVLGVAGVASAMFSANRPARLALMRWLASTTSELTSTNIALAVTESFAYFAGPAAAAAAVALADHEVALALPALMATVSGLVIRRLPAVEPPAEPVAHRMRAGFVVLARDAGVPTALFVIQIFVRGLLNVLVVAAAFEVLESGESGVGVLHAAFGVGGLVGVLLVGTAASTHGLVGRMALSFVVWGGPLTVIGLVPHFGVALAALALAGVANVSADVNGLTVLQRAVPGSAAPQAFAAFETSLLAGLAAGSVAAAGLHSTIGVRGGLVVAGLVLPVAVIAMLPMLRRLRRDLHAAERRLEAMRSVPSLAAMSVGALDVIARHAEDVRYAKGDHVFRAGDTADDVYVVLEGEATVLRPNGRRVATIRPGEIVGEVAALYGTTRTATVKASTELVALRVAGSDFARATSYSDDAHALVLEVVSGYGRWVNAAIHDQVRDT